MASVIGANRTFIASRPSIRHKRRLLGATALTVLNLLIIQPVSASPQGGRFVAGSGAIEAGASMTSVATATDRAIIDWSTFSIGAGETVSFAQPSAASAVLNRVTGGTISDIQGALRSNGEVFLLNPNGVIIGRDAVIDTAGFVASTLGVDAEDFLDGGDMTFSGDSDAVIRNLGEIIAQRGDIVLIARHIENAGTLSAPQGEAALAAGGEVLLAHEGEKRIFVRAPAQGDVSIDNTGAIEGVRAEIAAHGGNIYSLAVNNEGVIRGSAVEVGARGAVRITAAGGDPDRAAIHLGGDVRADSPDGGGVIEVDAGAAGTVWANGRVAAASDGSGERGGEVSITGRRVALTDNAIVDVSGAQGGGRVRIGGGLQGGDADIRNAEQTYVGADAEIRAAATNAGDGGEAIVWADEATQFYGHVDVQGGANGGDGGFTEVSGKQYLDFQGTANLSARAGFARGEILLDPTDITISSNPSAPASSGPPSVFSYAGGTSVLNVTDLEALLASGDVTVTTNGPGVAPGGGDITIETMVTVPIGSRLTLIADDDILSTIALPFTLGGAGFGAFLTLEAGGDVGSVAQRISMETVSTPNGSAIGATGENVYLQFFGPITMEDITATNGDVDIRNASDSNNPLRQTGDIIATGNIRIDSSPNTPGNQGHFMDQAANPVIRSTGGGDIDIITAGAGGIRVTRIETTGRVSISNSTNIGFIVDIRADPSGPPNIQAGALDITGYFRSDGTQIDIDTPQLNVDITSTATFNNAFMSFENRFAGDVTITNYTGGANVDYRQTGGGALNIAGPVSTGALLVAAPNAGDITFITDGDINIDDGNINTNAPITALNNISVTAGGDINIREYFSAGGTALFDADGDVLLVGLSSETIDAETTIDAGGDIRYDGIIQIRQPLTLRTAGAVFRVDEGVFGNSFFGAPGFAPVLTIEAGGDIGLPGDALVSIVGDTTLTGDNIFLRTDGGVRLNGVTAVGDFLYQNGFSALPRQLGIFGDVIAGGDIRFDLTNTNNDSIVMDQTANPVIRSTGGGDIVFDLADAGAHELTRLETDGAVVFTSGGSGIHSLADVSTGEAANIVAGSLVLDGYFTQAGADDIDIATSAIDIAFTNNASFLTFENVIVGDVVIANYTGAANIDYTQRGGGALILGAPVSAVGDIALDADGDIRFSSLNAGGGVTLNAAGSITDISGGGLANITAANAFLTAGGDIGSTLASLTLGSSIGVLNATAGGGLFVDSLGALQVGTGATAVSAGGDIDIVAANDLTVTNLAAATGDIALGSLNGAIVSNVALSGDAISLSAANDIGSAAAPVTLAVAVNTVSADGANVFLRALGDMGVNAVTATGAVSLDAAGAIRDRSAGEAPQIVADTVTLNAVNGVGEDDDLDLAARTIIADNAGAGDVRLFNTTAADASATIETAAGDIDMRQSGGGDLSVLGAQTLAGDIVIDVDEANLAARDLVAQGGGDILLGTGTPVDTLLTGTITADGDVRSVSRRNLTLDGATITAGGAIELVADNDAARPEIGPGVFAVAGASALSAGRVDIYAARPGQFLLGGGLTINGANITASDLTQDADGAAFGRYFSDPAQAPGTDGYLISFKNTNGPTQEESEQIIAEVVRAANDVTLAAPSTADPLMLYDAGGRTSFGASISYAEDRQLDGLAMSLAFSSSYGLSPNRYVSIERPWLFPVERQTADLTSIVRLLQNAADGPIDIDAAIIGEDLSCESIRGIVELVDNAEAYKQYRELCGALTASAASGAARTRASTWEAAQ